MSSTSFIVNPSPGRKVVKYISLSIFFILVVISIVSSIVEETYIKLLYSPVIIALFSYFMHLLIVGDVLITKVNEGIIELYYGYRYFFFVRRKVFKVNEIKSVTFYANIRGRNSADLIIYQLNNNEKHTRIFHPSFNSWWEKDYKILLNYFEELDIPVCFFAPENYDWNGFPTEKCKQIDSNKYPWITPKNIWTGGKYLNSN